jgi:hypothetical protein
LTNKEIETTRCVIGKAVNFPPDNIDILRYDEDDPRTAFMLDGFMGGFDLIINFTDVPTIEQAREDVKHLYMCGMEWEFDYEVGIT